MVDDMHLGDVRRVALDGGAGAAQVHQTGRGLVHLRAVVHTTSGQNLVAGGGGVSPVPGQHQAGRGLVHFGTVGHPEPAQHLEIAGS